MNQNGHDEIIVAGRRVPVYYENSSGAKVIPSSIERELVLNFIGRTLATPVTGLTIICGGAARDVVVTYQSVIENINTAICGIKAQGEIDRLNAIFHQFGYAIKQLESSDYPDDLKRIHKEQLKKRMDKRYQELEG